MHSFAIIFVRCLLALVLVANGALAQVHAHAMAGEPSAAETVAAEMPCHAGGEHGVPAGDPHPAPSTSDGCCGDHCICGCVFASVLPTLARVVAVNALERELAPVITHALAGRQPTRLLRPPIV